MLKSVAIAALAMSMAVAAQDQNAGRTEIQVTPDIARKCDEEGGCRLLSLRAFASMVNRAQQEALQEGFRQGFKQGTEQACRRGDV